MAIQSVKIGDLVVDDEILPRLAKEREVVERYAAVLRIGGEMPPLEVFRGDKILWLADGRYRLEAYKSIEATSVPCNVQPGTRAMAIWFAAAANLKHGLPMKTGDRRHAALNILRDPLLGHKPDSEVAEQAGIGAATVGNLRRSLEAKGVRPSQPVVTVVRSGQSYTMNRSKIGRGPRKKKGHKAEPAAAVPKDALGVPIPEWLRQVVEDTVEMRSFQTQLGTVVTTVERLLAFTSNAGQFLDSAWFTERIQEMRNKVDEALFFCCCQTCRAAGKPRTTCSCGGRGWLTRAQYHSMIDGGQTP